MTAIAGSLSFQLAAHAQEAIEASAEILAKRSEPSMRTTAIRKLVERVEVETSFDFEGLVAAFERQLGHYDKAVGEELVRKRASWVEVIAARIE